MDAALRELLDSLREFAAAIDYLDGAMDRAGLERRLLEWSDCRPAHAAVDAAVRETGGSAVMVSPSHRAPLPSAGALRRGLVK